MLWFYGNGFIKRAVLLALVDILHKNNLCSVALGGLNSVCPKLEQTRTKSNEILEKNVPKNLGPMLFQYGRQYKTLVSLEQLCQAFVYPCLVP